MRRLTLGTIGFLFIAGAITVLLLYRSGFDIMALSRDISIYGKIGIILALYVTRNYFFIPSTVIIILTGVLIPIFPLALTLSIIGVSIGIAETYAIGYILSGVRKGEESGITRTPIDLLAHSTRTFVHEQLEVHSRTYTHHLRKYVRKIQHHGIKVVFFGCMFPLTPVDIIYYSAGFIRLRFISFFFAALLGELWLIILYTALGNQAERYTIPFVYGSLCILAIALIFPRLRRRFQQKKVG